MGDEKDDGMSRRDFLAAGASTLATSALLTSLLPAAVSAADTPKAGPADWPRYGYDIHNTRFNPNEKTIGKNNVDRLKIKWKFDIDVPIDNTPTVIGDTVFFGAPGAVYALDSQTGRQKWKFTVPTEAGKADFRRGLNYLQGRLFSGESGGHVHSFDAATGKELWNSDFSKEPEQEIKKHMAISSAVLAYEDKVYFGTTGYKNRVVCLNAGNGTTAWEYWVTGEHEIGKGASMWTSPALDEKERILYMGTGDPKVGGNDPVLFSNCILAFDADTGYLRWYYQAFPNDPQDMDFGCHPMIFDAVAPPRRKGAVRQCVAAGNKDGIHCCDRYTGQLYWHAQLTGKYFMGGPNVDSTAVAYNRVYVVSNSPTQLIGKPSISVTAALDGYSGRIVWWTYNLEGICEGPIAVANGVVYQGYNDGRMEALDADSGKVLWQFLLPTARKGGFSIANGALFCSNGLPNAVLEEGAPGYSTAERMARDEKAGTYSVYCFTVDGK